MLEETPRIHLMIKKLYDLYQRGEIEGEWVESFIIDMNNKMIEGRPFTDKQIAKIEELFEQY